MTHEEMLLKFAEDAYLVSESFDKWINKLEGVEIIEDFVMKVFEGRFDRKPVKALYNGGEHIFPSTFDTMCNTVYDRIKYVIQEYMLDTGVQEVYPSCIDYDISDDLCISYYKTQVLMEYEYICKKYNISKHPMYYKYKVCGKELSLEFDFYKFMNVMVAWCRLVLESDWHDSSMTDDEYHIVGSSNGYYGSNYNLFMRSTYGDNKKRRARRAK